MARAWKCGLVPDAKQQTEFRERCEIEAASDGGNLPRIMTVAGDTAEIKIEGVLTPKPDIFAWLFGGGNTSYAEIRRSLDAVAADPSIRKVVMNIASPGGQVSGLFDTLAHIEAFQKPITVRAAMACSAAYAIAAVAGKIEATNIAAEFGSIGVAITYLHFEELIEIASTDAPKKRPDPSTEEGKAIIREELDALHELFVDAIARGRGTTPETVNEEFGEGGVLLAGEAKRRKMIDKLPPPAARAAARAAAESPTEPLASGEPAQVEQTAPVSASATDSHTEENMDLKTLKAQHPEVYEAAVQDGVTKERKRVKAHIKIGTTCGAIEFAHKCIADGADYQDDDVQAEYMSARMNRADRSTRQTETDAAGAAIGTASNAPTTTAAEPEEIYASTLEELCGVKKKTAA